MVRLSDILQTYSSNLMKVLKTKIPSFVSISSNYQIPSGFEGTIYITNTSLDSQLVFIDTINNRPVKYIDLLNQELKDIQSEGSLTIPSLSTFIVVVTESEALIIEQSGINDVIFSIDTIQTKYDQQG